MSRTSRRRLSSDMTYVLMDLTAGIASDLSQRWAPARNSDRHWLFSHDQPAPTFVRRQFSIRPRSIAANMWCGLKCVEQIVAIFVLNVLEVPGTLSTEKSSVWSNRSFGPARSRVPAHNTIAIPISRTLIAFRLAITRSPRASEVLGWRPSKLRSWSSVPLTQA